MQRTACTTLFWGRGEGHDALSVNPVSTLHTDETCGNSSTNATPNLSIVHPASSRQPRNAKARPVQHTPITPHHFGHVHNSPSLPLCCTPTYAFPSENHQGQISLLCHVHHKPNGRCPGPNSASVDPKRNGNRMGPLRDRGVSSQTEHQSLSQPPSEGAKCEQRKGNRAGIQRDRWGNKKQCSRQLQCEVPCSVGNVINSSLFINSSLSSLPSTSHAACCPWGGPGVVWAGGSTGGGQGTFQSSCHYCITTWCFAPKGLRTITFCKAGAKVVVFFLFCAWWVGVDGGAGGGGFLSLTRLRACVLICLPDKTTGSGKQEAVLKATAVRSPLPVMSPIPSCPPCLLRAGVQRQRGLGQGVWGGGGGGGLGGGGRGHFIHPAITALPHGASPQRDFAQ